MTSPLSPELSSSGRDVSAGTQVDVYMTTGKVPGFEGEGHERPSTTRPRAVPLIICQQKTHLTFAKRPVRKGSKWKHLVA